MQIEDKRPINFEPSFLKVTLNWEDIKTAFFKQANPDIQLWFDFSSPKWETLSEDEKLEIYRKIVVLLKAQQTTDLGLEVEEENADA